MALIIIPKTFFSVVLYKIFITQYRQLLAWHGCVTAFKVFLHGCCWCGQDYFNLKLKIIFQKVPDDRCEQSTKHCGKLTVLTHLFCVVFLTIVHCRDNTYSAASAAIRHTSTLYRSVSSSWSTFHERHWQFVLNLLSFANVTLAFLSLDMFHCETIDKYGFAFQVCSCSSKQQDWVIL